MSDPMPDTEGGAGAPRIMRMGLAGLLVQFADRLDDAANRRALAFRERLLAEALDGVAEIAPSIGGVFLRLDPIRADHAAIEARLAALLKTVAQADKRAGARRWTIPAAFGADAGPDLGAVAAELGCPADAAVAELAARPLRVMALGFAPGLPYMGILPERWDIPRKAGLTPRAPAGAVVVAVRQAIVFPADTPTGWWHVGQTGFRGFRPEAAEPFLLRPGDEVVLRAVPEAELRALMRDDPEGGGATVAPVPEGAA